MVVVAVVAAVAVVAVAVVAAAPLSAQAIEPIDGKAVDLSKFRDQVLMVVNVASQ